MAVTVRDVATRAGVSPATVSRVLNKNHEITPATTEAVQRAIDTLGYERSATRRGRRATRRPLTPVQVNSIALLIPDNTVEAMLTPLTGQLLHGAEAAAREHGFQFLLTRLEDDGALSRCLAQRQVDGVIVRSGRMQPPATLPIMPTVWVFKSAVPPRSGDMVYPDNEAIGELAARYLLGRGRHVLAVLSQMPDHAEAQVRAEAFARVARAEGATVTVMECPDPTDCAAGAGQILDAEPEMDGLFLPIGDDQTEACVRALQARGRRLREDVDVISCNNDVKRLHAVNADLPNIDIRADEIGRVATETLLWRIEHPKEYRRVTLIEPRLVARGRLG